MTESFLKLYVYLRKEPGGREKGLGGGGGDEVCFQPLFLLLSPVAMREDYSTALVKRETTQNCETVVCVEILDKILCLEVIFRRESESNCAL